MSSEQDDVPEYEILPPEEAAAIDVTLPRAVGFKTLGLATIIAAILGAGGGAAFSVMAEKPAADLAPIKTELASIVTENKNLKAQIARLQRDVKAIPAPKAVNLSGIRTRLETLESAEIPVIDPDLVTRLEALNSDGGGGVMDLADIYARLEALENQPAAPVQAETVVPEIVGNGTVIPAFPKDAVLAALDAQDQSKGWLKRALGKHISVQSEDNPRYLVDLIEVDIAADNLEAALAKFDKLPPEARSAAQDWHKAVGL